MKRAFLLVTPITPFIGGAVMLVSLYNKNLDDAGVDDRAYRLSQNAKQNEVDKIAYTGGLVGLSAGVLGNIGLQASLSMSGLGLASGLIVFASKKIIAKQQANASATGNA
jgi:small-conductance mechanosensitive channel